VIIYLVLTFSLIITNSYIEFNGLTSNSGYHELPYWGRRAVNVSTFSEVILSPFELFKPLFIETGNLRDRESIMAIVLRFVALPFSFLLYFKSIRSQFLQYLNKRFVRN
jgi:hypothetical protein